MKWASMKPELITAYFKKYATVNKKDEIRRRTAELFKAINNEDFKKIGGPLANIKSSTSSFNINTPTWILFGLAAQLNVNIHWLLTGQGDMFLANANDNDKNNNDDNNNKLQIVNNDSILNIVNSAISAYNDDEDTNISNKDKLLDDITDMLINADQPSLLLAYYLLVYLLLSDL